MTLTNMISGWLETMKAMEGESETDLSADAEPDALDLNRAYRQMIAPLFVLTHEKALDFWSKRSRVFSMTGAGAEITKKSCVSNSL